MENGSKFYMVKKKALPEILLKVAEANVLLNRGKAKTIKEAIDAVGISRSSYYIKMTFSRFMKRFRERQLPL
mgnify:CR=1 FL=1